MSYKDDEKNEATVTVEGNTVIVTVSVKTAEREKQERRSSEADTMARSNDESENDDNVFEWMIRGKEHPIFNQAISCEANSKKEETDTFTVDSCDLDVYRYRIYE